MSTLKAVFLIPAASLIFFIASCAGMPERKIDSVCVMVYDTENSGVMNASIFIDGKIAGKTDIYGRLQFFADRQKEACISMEKEGYESVSTETLIRPGQVIYFKTGSAACCAQKAEKLLDEGEYEEALKMIGKALSMKERRDWLFLRKVIIRKKEGINE